MSDTVSLGTVGASVGLDLAPLQLGVKSAAKLISGLADQMEGLGKVKFGDGVERQLGGIGDIAKIVTGDIGGLSKSLGSIKFNPVGIIDGVTDAQRSIGSLQASLDGLNFDPAGLTASIGLVTGELRGLIAQADIAKASLSSVGGASVGGFQGGGHGGARPGGGSRVNMALEGAGSAGMVSAVVGGGLTYAAVKQAGDWQKILLDMKSNTQMSQQDFAMATNAIRTYAAQQGADMADAAKAFRRVFNHDYTGKGAKQIVDAAMESSVATGSSMEDTANLLAQQMFAFKIDPSKAKQTMNVLHTSMQRGNMDMGEFVSSAGYGVNALASFKDTTGKDGGLDIKDAFAALSTLTKLGFDPAQAATQLRSLGIHIVAPSAAQLKVADALKASGRGDLRKDLSLEALQTKGLHGILDDIGAATQGHPDVALKLMNAQRGGIGAMLLSGTGLGTFHNIYGQLEQAQAGKLDPITPAFNDRLGSWDNQVAQFENQVKELGQDIGTLLLPELESWLKWLKAAVSVIQHLPKPVQGGIAKGVLGLGVAGVGAAGVSGFGRAMQWSKGFFPGLLAGGAGSFGVAGMVTKGGFGLPGASLLSRLTAPLGWAVGGNTGGQAILGSGGGGIGSGLFGGAVLAAPAMFGAYMANKIMGQQNAGYDAEQRGYGVAETGPWINKLAELRKALKKEPGNADIIGQIKEIRAYLKSVSGVRVPVQKGSTREIDRWDSIINRVGAEQGVSPGIIKAIIHNETGGNPLATNHNRNGTTDYGIMQVNSATKDPNTYNWRDPYTNMVAGVTEFKEKLRQAGGNLREGFRRYNGRGPAAEAYADRAMAFLGGLGSSRTMTTGPASPSYASHAPHLAAAKDWYSQYQRLTDPAQVKAGKVAAGINVQDGRLAVESPMSKYDKQRMQAVFAYQDKAGKPGVDRGKAFAALSGKLTQIGQTEDAAIQKHKETIEKHLASIRQSFDTFVAGMVKMTGKADAKTVKADKAPDELETLRDGKLEKGATDYTRDINRITKEHGTGAISPEKVVAAVQVAQAKFRAARASAWAEYNAAVAKQTDDAAKDFDALSSQIAAATAHADSHTWRDADAEAREHFQNLRDAAHKAFDKMNERIKDDSKLTDAQRQDAYAGNQGTYDSTLADYDMQESDAAKKRKVNAAAESYSAAQDNYAETGSKQGYANDLAAAKAQIPQDGGLAAERLRTEIDRQLKALGQDGKGTVSELGKSVIESLGSAFDQAMSHAKKAGSVWKEIMQSMKLDAKSIFLSFLSKEFKDALTALFTHKEKGVTPQSSLAGTVLPSAGAASLPGSTLFGGLIPSVKFGGGSQAHGLSGLLGAMPLLSSLSSIHGINGPIGGPGSTSGPGSSGKGGGLMDIAGLAASFLPGGSLLGKLFSGGLFGGGLFGGLKKLHLFKNGGIVPGAGFHDSVPALLTPGEVVSNHAQQKAQGGDTHFHFNHYGDVHGVDDMEAMHRQGAFMLAQQLTTATPGN